MVGWLQVRFIEKKILIFVNSEDVKNPGNTRRPYVGQFCFRKNCSNKHLLPDEKKALDNGTMDSERQTRCMPSDGGAE